MLFKGAILVLSKIRYNKDEQLIWLGAALKRLRLADRQIDLFSGIEFIAPDVAYSSRQRTPGHEKTRRLSRLAPAEVCAYSNLIVK